MSIIFQSMRAWVGLRSMFVCKIRSFETEQTIEIKKHIFFNFFYFKIIKIHLRNILKTYLFYISSFIIYFIFLVLSFQLNTFFFLSFGRRHQPKILPLLSSPLRLIVTVISLRVFPRLLSCFKRWFGYRYCRWRNWLSNLKGKWKSDFHICVWIHGRRTVLQGSRVGMTLWGQAFWMPISTPYGLDLVIMIQYHIADLTWIII